MAKLDSNAAWKEATSLVAGNREVLFVLAGVFFMLPSLLLSIVLGEPSVDPAGDSSQMAATLIDFYSKGWWLILLASMIQVIGILTVLTLMRDRRRPTVGEAIRAGFADFPTYFAAQLLFVVAVGLIGGVFIAAGTLIAPVLAVVMTLLVLGFAIFAAIRLIMVAPIVAVEGQRNPVAALARAWTMTRGNFWRMLVFFLLVGILFVVAMAVIMILVGIVLVLVSQGETQRVLASVVSSALSAVAVLYFLGMLAAIHRQLAAGGGDERSGGRAA